MTYGLTDQGLIIPRLSEIKSDIETILRAKLGNGINLDAHEPLGQAIGIFSEREALLWEQMQAVYNSQYPPTAEGVSLDLCVALTGQKRLDATKSTVSMYCTGTVGTVIPQGSIVSQANNADLKFASSLPATIGAGVNEVQKIAFGNIPNNGSFTLIFEGESTIDIPHNSVAADVENALNALNALTAASVAGDFATGFVVTFAGVDGSKPQPAIAVGANSLNMGGLNTSITITEQTPGQLPNVSILFQAVEKGAKAALAGTLTVIETQIAGWDDAINPYDVVVGKNIETDSELRIRRDETLANPGSTTQDAMYAKLRAIDDVIAARVFTNRENVVDGAGRPPKSVHCILQGGVNADIAQKIWANVPAGIEMIGAQHVVVVDSQGYNQDVYFDRPTGVDVWIKVELLTNSAFPNAGEDTIKAHLLDYCLQTFSIGDDVIVDWLYCPINCVPGITDISIKIDTVNPPLGTSNITIADIALAMFDSARITVTDVTP